MYRLLFYALALMLAFGCYKDDLVEKPFFSTESLPLDFSETRINDITLEASISILSNSNIDEQCDQLAEFGFFFSKEKALVEAGDINVRFLASGPLDNQRFTMPTPPMEPNIWYYFSPFVNCNERSIQGVIDSFKLEINLVITPLDRPRSNDTIDYKLDFSGIPLLPSGVTIGYILIAENRQDTVPLTPTERIGFRIIFPHFNTTYTLRPYLYDGFDYYFGEDLSVILTDGWIPIGDLPKGLQEAEAITVEDVTYLFGGCEGDCFTPAAVNSDIYALTFSGGSEPRSLEWSVDNRFRNSRFTERWEGAAFRLEDTIWHVLGRYIFEPAMNVIIEQRLDNGSYFNGSRVANDFPLEIRRRAPVAFVQDERVFLGLGDDNNIPRPEFYEFRYTGEGSPELIPVESGRISARREAVAVKSGISTLVGTGIGTSSERADFYRFITPTPDQPLGDWVSVAFFPSARRSASAFSVNGRAFVGLGRTGNRSYFRDLYEFNENNGPGGEWVPRQPFPGRPRAGAAAFSVNDYGCICGGVGADPGSDDRLFFKDCWLYEPVAE